MDFPLWVRSEGKVIADYWEAEGVDAKEKRAEYGIGNY